MAVYNPKKKFNRCRSECEVRELIDIKSGSYTITTDRCEQESGHEGNHYVHIKGFGIHIWPR